MELIIFLDGFIRPVEQLFIHDLVFYPDNLPQISFYFPFPDCGILPDFKSDVLLDVVNVVDDALHHC